MRERLGRRLVGRERRVARVAAEHACAARRRRRRAARARSSRPSGSLRSSSSASSQPSRAPARNSCRMPSVASIRRPSTSYQPASGAMFGKPLAERKRSSSSSGFTPGSTRRNAFSISSSPNTIDELDCSTPDGAHVDRPAERGRRRLRPAEDELVLARLQLGVGAHPVQQLTAVRRVGERVVDDPAVGLEDRALRPAVVGRPEAEQQLVGLVRPGGEARLDEAQHEQRRLAAQRDARRRSSIERHLARLGGEPALRDDPLVELLLVEERQVAGGDGVGRPSFALLLLE